MQVVESDRKHHGTHLLAQHQFQALLHRRRAEEPEVITGLERRGKKRETLDVIPVGVAEEHITTDRLAIRAAHQGTAEFTDTGTGVEDDEMVVVAAHFHTGRISTVRNGRRAR